MTRKKTIKCQDCGCKVTLARFGPTKKRCAKCGYKRQRKQIADHHHRIRHTFKRLPKMPDNYFDMTLDEVAGVEGISKQRIEQIELEAIYKLRLLYEALYGVPDFEEVPEPYSTPLMSEDTTGEVIAGSKTIPINNQFQGGRLWKIKTL